MRFRPEWIGKTPDTKVPPRVLLRIFVREGGICHISGRKIRPSEKWQADHKIALCNGGEHRESNLFPALGEPHKEKTKLDVAEKKRTNRIRSKHLGIKKTKHRWPKRKMGYQPSNARDLNEDMTRKNMRT